MSMMDEIELKEKHLELAAVIKDVHAKLRSKTKRGESFDTVWEKHCKDRDVLKKYATSMHELATKIWAKNDRKTRIDWCKETCLEYFTGDGLLKVLEKEKRKQKFKNKSNLQDENNSTLKRENSEGQYCQNDSDGILPGDKTQGVSLDGACSVLSVDDPNFTKVTDLTESEKCGTKLSTNETVNETKLSTNEISIEDLLQADKKMLCLKYGPEHQNKICLPFESRIRLLDVGSCYNPFEQFPEFISIALDLLPAVETVYKCDLLHLDISKPLQMTSDTIDSIIKCLKNPVEEFPEESVHVVVFSLLLEYLPSAYHRWICCEKAHKLLMENGLLIIITPDSHHQNKNAPRMKCWKQAIESIGFKRWRYLKQEHLHCMAFRKVSQEELKDNIMMTKVSENMLLIPQDLKEESLDDENHMLLNQESRNEDENTYIREGFSELPVVDE